MKILVCISKTPETTARISFKNDNTEFNSEGVQYIMNPYDEWYALVRAIELKESLGGTVTAVNVGPSSNDVIIRKALAIGADDAVRINAEPESSLYTATQIAEYARGKEFDIILTGKETIDFNGAETGAMIAELLGLPYISFATNLEVEDGNAIVARDIEGGTETAKISLPLVLSAAKGMAEQRIPNMRGIMMAKRKPLEVLDPVEARNSAEIFSYELPDDTGSVRMVDPENMDELVRLLKEEAKVI